MANADAEQVRPGRLGPSGAVLVATSSTPMPSGSENRNYFFAKALKRTLQADAMLRAIARSRNPPHFRGSQMPFRSPVRSAPALSAPRPREERQDGSRVPYTIRRNRDDRCPDRRNSPSAFTSRSPSTPGIKIEVGLRIAGDCGDVVNPQNLFVHCCSPFFSTAWRPQRGPVSLEPA